jgi:hypothetical protein
LIVNINERLGAAAAAAAAATTTIDWKNSV